MPSQRQQTAMWLKTNKHKTTNKTKQKLHQYSLFCAHCLLLKDQNPSTCTSRNGNCFPVGGQFCFAFKCEVTNTI